MSEHRPDYDPELDLRINEIDKIGQTEPFNARQRAMRFLRSVFGEQEESEDNNPSLGSES